jgi:hypothetical protein
LHIKPEKGEEIRTKLPIGCVVYTSTHCGIAINSHYYGTLKEPYGTSPFLSAINVALDKTLPTNLELVKQVDYLVRCYYAQMFTMMFKCSNVFSDITFTITANIWA